MIERNADRGLVGNIYLGKVQRVLPGMQAAFVELGMGNKAAFLYVGDVVRAQPSLDPQDAVEESDKGSLSETEAATHGSLEQLLEADERAGIAPLEVDPEV